MLIFPIVRTALVALRRDRPSLALSFILPIAFFYIFAVIIGGRHDSQSKISVILVDQDRSQASIQLSQALQREEALTVTTHPSSKPKQAHPPDYTAATAEDAVKAGDAPVALIIPRGWGVNPIAFNSAAGQSGPALQLLNDQSDTIAPQMVAGLLQKTAMTAMPLTMAEQGMKYAAQYIGGFTPAQRALMDSNMARLRQLEAQQASAASSNSTNPSAAGSSAAAGGLIAVQLRPVMGKNTHDMISFYAAAIGVMFLLFTASGSSGALLDEAESGTIDRVLSSRITMTSLLAGKLVFNTLLAFTQLTVMFLWAWSVFHLDFFSHIPGFVVMGLCTALAVAAFGLLLASLCHTRAQLGALSTLIILVMSSIGGSMFPRFLMPPAMQKAGLFTINAWAIDGFTKVFWRDLPVSALWPQVGVLLAAAIVLFLVARRIARRWEYA